MISRNDGRSALFHEIVLVDILYMVTFSVHVVSFLLISVLNGESSIINFICVHGSSGSDGGKPDASSIPKSRPFVASGLIPNVTFST